MKLCGVAILTVLALLLAPAPARAQGYEMRFSVYTDLSWSGNGSTVYAAMSGADLSWGCYHHDYVTTGTLNSPSGVVDSGEGTGLHINLLGPFNNQDGSWFFGGTFTFECDCGGTFEFEWGTSSAFVRVPKYVRRLGSEGYAQGPPAPYVYIINREILDQFGHPLERMMFVNESFSPDPPSGNCTSLTVDQGDALSTPGGTFGPDFYIMPANPPSPCSSTSTQSFVIDGYPIVTTYTITWRDTGVSVVGHSEY